MPSRFLVCPHCRSDLRNTNDHLTCDVCARNYTVLAGIVDFRDSSVDSTANFSIEGDLALADKLLEALPITSTFNELLDIYNILKVQQKNGDDISRISIATVIRDNSIKALPLTSSQLLHGKAIFEKIDEHLQDAKRCMPPNQVALENGSGLGFFIDELSARFNELVVLDFSLSYLILARKLIEERDLQNVSLICGSVERLPLRSNCVDFIHSNNVIEHVSDQSTMFSEAERVLKRKGLLFVLSPNRFSLYFEPHFRLPCYGFFPEPVRRKIIQKTQNRDIDDISLRSLDELRQLAAGHFANDVYIVFIPRHLKRTATGGTIRNALVKGLNSKIFGSVTNWVINKALLGVMPYHTMLCFKS